MPAYMNAQPYHSIENGKQMRPSHCFLSSIKHSRELHQLPETCNSNSRHLVMARFTSLVNNSKETVKTKFATAKEKFQRSMTMRREQAIKVQDPEEQNTREGPCADYCCSPFATFKDVSDVELGDLSNPIHPLFAREKFSANFDYSVIEPCLRFATRMLESDAAVKFLNVVTEGQMFDLKGNEVKQLQDLDEDGAKWRLAGTVFLAGRRVPRPGQDQVNDTTRSRAREILKELGNIVHFVMLNAEEMEDSDKIAAQAVPLQGPLRKSAFGVFPNGCLNRVHIQDYNYHRLVARTNALFNPPNDKSTDEHIRKARINLLIARLFFSQLLMHELGHCLGNGANGDRNADFKYCDEQQAELGFAFESELFGGMLDAWDAPHIIPPKWQHACQVGKALLYDRFLTLGPWPSKHRQQIHELGGVGLDLTTDKKYDTFSRVAISHIESLFTDEYWETEVSKRGIAAIHSESKGKWTCWYKILHAGFDEPSNIIHRYEGPQPFKFEKAVECFGEKEAAALCSLPDSFNHLPSNENSTSQEEILETSGLNYIEETSD